MAYNYFIADVFTREMFNGAQIAVFPEADGLSDEQMALLAAELNLSETVFLLTPENNTANKKVRIFSPSKELGFAGHPIVATASILASCGNAAITEGSAYIVLQQNDELIKTNVAKDGEEPVFVQFTRRVASTIDRFSPTEQELAAILGIRQADIDNKKYTSRLVSCGFPYLVVPVFNYETARKAAFNYEAWSQSLAPQTAAQEILIFTPTTPYADADFHLRLLGPDIGINEDPPVGAAIPAFAAYLCSHEHVRKGTYTFSVDRGDVQGRRSVLNLEMDNKGQSMLTIRVGGHAVISAEGSFNI